MFKFLVLTDFVVTACNVDVTSAKPLKTHSHIFDEANKAASGRNGKAFIFGLPAHQPQNPLVPVKFMLFYMIAGNPGWNVPILGNTSLTVAPSAPLSCDPKGDNGGTVKQETPNLKMQRYLVFPYEE